MTSYSKLGKTQQLTLVAISDYKATQGFSHCMNPEEETAFSSKFMWTQEKENPKGGSIILLYIQGNKVKTVEITYPSQKLGLSPYLPRKTYHATWFFHILTYLHYSVRENSPQHTQPSPLWPLLSPDCHPQASGQTEAQFSHERTQDEWPICLSCTTVQ